MPLIEMIKSIFHPPSYVRIGYKNQRIVFAQNIGIWDPWRFVGSSVIPAIHWTSLKQFFGSILKMFGLTHLNKVLARVRPSK